MADSNSAGNDGAHSEVDQPLGDCKGCGAPTDVDDLAEGYCYMCIAEDVDDPDYPEVPEGAELDACYGDVYDDDSDPWGSTIA